jgi:hypothetical protein
VEDLWSFGLNAVDIKGAPCDINCLIIRGTELGPEPYALDRKIWVDNSTTPVTVWYVDHDQIRVRPVYHSLIAMVN